MHPIIQRTLAFCIDFCILGVYAGLIYAATLSGSLARFREDPSLAVPLGLVVFMLPAFLYYFLSENSKSQATPGKKLFKIKVAAAGTKAVFWRNMIRFMPIVMLYCGLVWAGHYEKNGYVAPVWVYALALIPQAIEVFNLIGIVATRGESGLYDGIAGTRVVRS